MKKRVLSFLLVVCMILGMVPVSAATKAEAADSITVYRNPVLDKAGAQLSLEAEDLDKFDVRPETIEAWKASILQQAGCGAAGNEVYFYVPQLGREAMAGVSVYSFAQLMETSPEGVMPDAYATLEQLYKSWYKSNELKDLVKFAYMQDIITKEQRDDLYVLIDLLVDTGLTPAPWFGWRAVANGSAGATVEDVRIVTNKKYDTTYDEDYERDMTTLSYDTVKELKVNVKGYVDVAWNIDGTDVFAQVPLNSALIPSTEAVAAAEAYAASNGKELVGWAFADGQAIDTAKVIDVTNNGGTAYAAADIDGIKLYPVYDAIKYTVTWVNDNGDVLETDADVYVYGDTPSYDGATPVAKNVAPAGKEYVFVGWEPVVSAVTGDVTYKAVYAEKDIKYTVTWVNDNGDVLETDTDVYVYGETPKYDGATPVAQVTEPGKTYEFVGWEPVVSAVTGDVTYKAVYTTATIFYTVSFDANGGTAVTDARVGHGDPIIAITTTTRDGYQFVGWSLDGTKNTLIDLATYKVTEAVELTAVWAEVFDVVFDDGTTVTTVPVVDGKKVDESVAPGPTKPGYVFDGWLKDGKKYDFNSVVTEDITLVAKWLKEYKVTLDANYAGGQDKEQTFVQDELQQLMSVSRPGYRLLGWSTDPNATVASYSVQDWYVFGADETLYAVWEEIPVYLTVENSAVTVTYGSFTSASLLKEIAPSVIKNDAKVDGAVVEIEDIEENAVGTYPVKLSYYDEDSKETVEYVVTVTIKPATASIVVDSKKVEHGTIVKLSDLIKANCPTISVLAGVSALGGDDLLGQVQVALSDALYFAVDTIADSAGVKNLKNLSIEDIKVLAAKAGAVPQFAAYKDTIDKMVGLLEKVKNYLPQSVELKISIAKSVSVSEMGVYMIASIGEDMTNYTSADAAGALVITSNADVAIVDGNGNENKVQVYTYGEEIKLNVTVDGKTGVDGLTVKYIGSDTTLDGWNREEVPTDAGVYVVVAVYTDYEAGTLVNAGAAVGTLVIKPADADLGLKDAEYCYDGKEHFATIENSKFNYVTVAVDSTGKVVYVNLPDNTEDYVEKLVSMLPAGYEAKVRDMLAKYEDFDGDASTANIKEDATYIIDKMIAYDMTAKATELIREIAVEMVNKVGAGKYSDMLVDQFTEIIVDGVAIVNGKVEVNVDLIKEKMNALAAKMGVNLPDSVMNKLNAVINKAEDYIDVDAITGTIDSAIESFKAKGYVGYAKNKINAMAAIFGLDVSTVLTKVEDMADVIENMLTSGNFKVKDLESIEGYVEAILAEVKAVVAQIPDGTVVVGKDPSAAGKYDCYAVNVSANYMPELLKATLTIHKTHPADKYVVTTETIEEVASDCKVPGHVTVKITTTCGVCGAVVSTETTTENLPLSEKHVAGKEVVENYVAATATKDGSYDLVTYCSVCGKELKRVTKTIPATGEGTTPGTDPVDPTPGTDPVDPTPGVTPGEAPDSGDHNNFVLWGLAMIVSVVCAGVALFEKKRRLGR